MIYLGRGGVDWLIQEVVVEKANKLRIEELEAVMKRQAAEIINALAKALK